MTEESRRPPILVRARNAVLTAGLLTYSLYRTELGFCRGCSYSLVVMLENGRGSESASAFDISRSHVEADRIFSAVADGCVTPCALADVLEELL